MSLKQRLQRLEAKARSKEPERLAVIDARGKSEGTVFDLCKHFGIQTLYIIIDF